MARVRLYLSLALLSGLAAVLTADSESFLPNLFPFTNSNGILANASTAGKVDLTGPFFQSLGTNGRSCGSCHQPSDAMSVSANHVQLRFDLTFGLDPIFH